MVVITIVTKKNVETVYFDKPTPIVHFMKLISCSFLNLWYTLKNGGSVVLGDEKVINQHLSVNYALLPASSEDTDFVREYEQDRVETYFIATGYSTNHVPTRV